MNFRTLFLAAALGLSASFNAYAGGIPVIDTASLANSKAQFLKEIAEMAKELEEAKKLYDSLNGITNMGDIVSLLNNPKVRDLLGPEAGKIATAFDVDINSLGDLSTMANKALDHLNVDQNEINAEDYYRKELDRINKRTAANVALGDKIIRSADDRLNGLEQLRQKINSAGTQKDIAALQARLQVETALLQNDTNRISGLAMLQNAQDKLEQQRAEEDLIKHREETYKGLKNVFGKN